LIATNDVHYHVPERRPLHEVLTAIRLSVTVAELGQHRFPNGERYLQTSAAMHERFARCPKAIAHAGELSERCHFTLDELRYDYPEELCPGDLAPIVYLKELTWAGARRRFAGNVPDKVGSLLRHELNLIEELHYEAFFLTVWDLVRFAKSKS